MTLAPVLLFLLIQVCRSGRITRDIGDKCSTPNSEAGECRNLKNCPVLLDLVKNGEAPTTSYLRDSNCGFQGIDSLVCCPELSSRLTPWENPYNNLNRRTTSRPPISSEFFGTRRTTRRPSDNSEFFDNRATTRRPSESSEIRGTRYTTRRPSDSSEFDGTRSTTSECGRAAMSVGDRIVGGEAAEAGSWPWISALGYRSRSKSGIQWLCGGALVSERHVITAGHCVVIPADKTLAVVRLGDVDLNDGVQDGARPVDYEVEQTIPHPEYKSSAKVNDIAIVKLKTSVTFNDNIQPICLPSSGQLRSGSLVGKTPYVAGWGALFFRGPATKALQQVDVSVTDEESCRRAYQTQRGAVIDSRVLCASKPGKDACQGDSGGPLMLDQGVTYYLIGVVSYGKNCADPGFPGVYTKVSSFMDWINRNLN